MFVSPEILVPVETIRKSQGAVVVGYFEKSHAHRSARPSALHVRTTTVM